MNTRIRVSFEAQRDRKAHCFCQRSAAQEAPSGVAAFIVAEEEDDTILTVGMICTHACQKPSVKNASVWDLKKR